MSSKADRFREMTKNRDEAQKPDDYKGQVIQGILGHEPETVQINEHVTEHENENTESLLRAFDKQRVEDTHTRATYLIKNETLKKLEKISRGKGKGFKTQLVNYALERMLDDLSK